MNSYDRAIINTPLGPAEILGDTEGVAAVSVLDDKVEVSEIIPDGLQQCVQQLNEYFTGDRKEFRLKLNPQGTIFQKKVWQALQDVPYGKKAAHSI